MTASRFVSEPLTGSLRSKRNDLFESPPAKAVLRLTAPTVLVPASCQPLVALPPSAAVWLVVLTALVLVIVP